MATDVTIQVGVGDYDHTRDLADGRVQVPGFDLRCTVLPTPEEIFARFLGGEWHAAEMSLAVASALRSRDDGALVVLPIFPARSFRHGAIFVRSDGPSAPQELAGTRIGVAVWTQTAGVYVRGLLSSRYGIDLTAISWVQAGVDAPGRREPVALEADPFKISEAADTSLNDLLLGGEVDAVISARPPACIEQGDPRVRRLFANPVEQEIAYYRETGVFPIMHTLVLRRHVYDEAPAAADALVQAFTEAKRRALTRATIATVPSYPLPWTEVHARQARDLIGEDFWPYGVEPNRTTLDAFLGFCAEQRITRLRLRPEDLFAGDPVGAGGA